MCVEVRLDESLHGSADGGSDDAFGGVEGHDLDGSDGFERPGTRNVNVEAGHLDDLQLDQFRLSAIRLRRRN